MPCNSVHWRHTCVLLRACSVTTELNVSMPRGPIAANAAAAVCRFTVPSCKQRNNSPTVRSLPWPDRPRAKQALCRTRNCGSRNALTSGSTAAAAFSDNADERADPDTANSSPRAEAAAARTCGSLSRNDVTRAEKDCSAAPGSAVSPKKLIQGQVQQYTMSHNTGLRSCNKRMRQTRAQTDLHAKNKRKGGTYSQATRRQSHAQQPPGQTDTPTTHRLPLAQRSRRWSSSSGDGAAFSSETAAGVANNESTSSAVTWPALSVCAVKGGAEPGRAAAAR